MSKTGSTVDNDQKTDKSHTRNITPRGNTTIGQYLYEAYKLAYKVFMQLTEMAIMQWKKIAASCSEKM